MSSDDMQPPLPRGLGHNNQPDDRIWLLGLVLALFPVPIILGFISFYYALRRIRQRWQDAATSAGRPYLHSTPSTGLDWCFSDPLQQSQPSASRMPGDGSGMLPFSISETHSEELTLEAAMRATSPALQSPLTAADEWQRAWSAPTNPSATSTAATAPSTAAGGAAPKNTSAPQALGARSSGDAAAAAAGGGVGWAGGTRGMGGMGTAATSWQTTPPPPPLSSMEARVTEIDIDNVVFEKRVGQGSFGSVFLATWQETTVAVKVLSAPAAAAIARRVQKTTEKQHQAQQTTEKQHQAQQQVSNPGATALASTSPGATTLPTTATPPTLEQRTAFGSHVDLAPHPPTHHPTPTPTYAHHADEDDDDDHDPLSTDTPGDGTPRHPQQGSPRGLLKREAQLLAGLRHPNVLLLMGFCLQPPCMITEYCAMGSLLDVLALAKREGTFGAQLTWGRRLGMALDAAKGMLYLHGVGVGHRDLKSDNLMVDLHWRVKVADFNLAALLGQSEVGGGGVANPRWLAPEVLSGGPFHTAADVYGFGLVLWELMTWKVPWQGANPLHIVLAVAERGQRPEVPPPGEVQGGAPLQYDEYVSLMCDCWAQDPAARPSFEVVIRRLRVLLQAEGGPG